MSRKSEGQLIECTLKPIEDISKIQYENFLEPEELPSGPGIIALSGHF